MRQNSRLNLDFSFSDGLSSRKQRFNEPFGLRVFKIGYEVYVDGLTRVLRICEHADNPKIEKVQWPLASIQFRISYACIHLLDKGQVCSLVPLISSWPKCETIFFINHVSDLFIFASQTYPQISFPIHVYLVEGWGKC